MFEGALNAEYNYKEGFCEYKRHYYCLALIQDKDGNTFEHKVMSFTGDVNHSGMEWPDTKYLGMCIGIIKDAHYA